MEGDAPLAQKSEYCLIWTSTSREKKAGFTDPSVFSKSGKETLKNNLFVFARRI
jgi:hypothetical protein